MPRRKKSNLKWFDYLMLSIIVILVLALPTVVVFSKSALSRTNIQVERMRTKLAEQETINESLTMKMNELASLSNIQEIAKEHGISYNNDNIILIR